MSESKLKTKLFERYKILWQISEASPIIRRYFAMNFFDGILTALGIVLASFLFFLDDKPQSNMFLFLTSLITAIAIGISGLTGSHLAETAERRLNVIQMKQVLGLQHEEDKTSTDSDVPKWSENDLKLALGEFEKSIRKKKSKMDVQYKHLGLTEDQARKLGIKLGKSSQDSQNIDRTKVKTSYKKYKGVQKEKKIVNEQTIYEEAQHFAGIVAALVDGFSPFAGVMIVVLPFIFSLTGDTLAIQFIISFILTVVVLFSLGGYLAKLSKDSIIKYGLQMVFAAVMTSAITLLLNTLINFE
nr:VIT1/CCC1 transporter family protein [Candidatus Prometheoarchaeum syntrophicum]QEE15876.1 VIT family protein [Candidatus Prometheoarchaeum syntrophicum]